LTRLRAVSGNPVARLVKRGPGFALGPVDSNRAVEVAGALRVEGDGRTSGLEAVGLGLAWVEVETGAVNRVPLDVELEEGEFRLRSVARLPAAEPAWLRLRLIWRNSAWETEVVRLAGGELSRPE